MLPIYSSSLIQQYQNKTISEDTVPHVFAIASDAYRGLIQDMENQSVVIRCVAWQVLPDLNDAALESESSLCQRRHKQHIENTT